MQLKSAAARAHYCFHVWLPTRTHSIPPFESIQVCKHCISKYLNIYKWMCTILYICETSNKSISIPRWRSCSARWNKCPLTIECICVCRTVLCCGLGLESKWRAQMISAQGHEQPSVDEALNAATETLILPSGSQGTVSQRRACPGAKLMPLLLRPQMDG